MDSKKEEKIEQLDDLLDSIYQGLKEAKVPEKVKQKAKEELEDLKAFIFDARPARIAIVGRRGAGKSSLINAIFSEVRAEVGDVKAQTGTGRWHSYTSDLGALDILDTRGLGEGEEPAEAFTQSTALEEVKASIKEKCPDVILFLSKAKEVSSRLDADISQLLDIKRTIQELHGYQIPIVGIVTQVDELSPRSDGEPPFAHPVKQQNIAAAEDVLSAKLSKAVADPVKVIPVCSYFETEEGRIVYDIRWNIDILLNYLIEHLPNEAQMILAKLSKVKTVQKKLSRRIGKSIAGITGLIGANPIPVADLPVITGMQMMMVSSVALISGRRLRKKEIKEFLSALGINIAAGFVFRQAARQLIKLVPGAGYAVSGMIASAGTYALCEAAIAYFIEDNPLPRVKTLYRETFQEHQNER